MSSAEGSSKDHREASVLNRVPPWARDIAGSPNCQRFAAGRALRALQPQVRCSRVDGKHRRRAAREAPTRQEQGRGSGSVRGAA